MAGYYYDVTTSHLVALALRPFPLTSCTSTHDDGTLDGPIAVRTTAVSYTHLTLPTICSV
eukprot:143158-Prymnesium_polylepis.1